MKMTMTATGDSIVDLGFEEGGYPGFQEVRDFIMRGEARFTNLEMNITNCNTYPSAFSGGIWHFAGPKALRDIASYGFNMMGYANNHTLDWGPDGLRETVEHVRTLTDISLAGAGEDLAEASEPAFRDFPGGRVALISLSSSFNDSARAGYASKTVKGRPGLNPLRFQQYYTVNEEHFRALQEIAAGTKMNGQRDISRSNGFLPPLPEDTFDFGGLSFKLSENGREEKINHPHPDDVERTMRSIRDAKRIADYVVVMVHSHQIAADKMYEPDHFFREFAHTVIDAGADAVLGGGTHELKPVELYRGKPVFYSLGNFAFQLNTFRRQPDDMRYEDHCFAESDVDVLANRFKNWENGLWVQRQNFISVVPYLEFEDGKLTRAELLPVDLGFEGPKRLKGFPKAGDEAFAEEVKERLNALSAADGTKFVRKGRIIELVL